MSSPSTPNPPGSTEPRPHPFDELLGVMARLRSDEGCPWDREQTHRSLKPFLIEESYEVWEAIDSGEGDALCEELGDVLLQVIFHAQIAREDGRFDAYRVIETLKSKLIRRHPHVFGSERLESPADVKRRWAEIKEEERNAAETAARGGPPTE